MILVFHGDAGGFPVRANRCLIAADFSNANFATLFSEAKAGAGEAGLVAGIGGTIRASVGSVDAVPVINTGVKFVKVDASWACMVARSAKGRGADIPSVGA